MKKVLSAVTALLGIVFMFPAFAVSDFTKFTTIEQAEQYCPALNGLTFTSNDPSNPKSVGSIEGNNHVVFVNVSPAPHPLNMDTNGVITDAQFRKVGEIYGYISGNTVTCLYSYTSIFNTTYNLIMRGQ